VSGPAHYFVTDIECDGPDPALNSMLSFATVVVREDGAELLTRRAASELPVI